MFRRIVAGFIGFVLIASGLSGIAGAERIQPTETTLGTYAALGDSIASGAGLPYGPGSNDTICQRSTEAYAYSVVPQTSDQLIHAACGGATITNLFTSQQSENITLEPQLDAAFANGTPQLITITAGANDMHWSDFLKLCLSDQSCDTRQNTYTINALLVGVRAKLIFTLASIAYRSHGNPPRVIVTGYYNPVSTACTAVVPTLSSSEVTWIGTQIGKLNKALQSTASLAPFAKYAPVSFAGHDVCSTSPWVQGIGSTAPFHPTTSGQAAIAAAVSQKL